MEKQMLPNKSHVREEDKPIPQKYLKRRMKQRAAIALRQTVPGTSRAPSRTRTGTTPHFRAWMADLQMKSALQKIKLNTLADAIDDSMLASGFALLYVGQVKNIYDLLRQSTAHLLSLPGIEIEHLSRVEQYLINYNVKPAWSVLCPESDD